MFRRLFLVPLLLIPALSQAHFLWAVLDPKTKLVHIEIAETPGTDIAPILNQFKPAIQTTGLAALQSQPDGKALNASLTKGSTATAAFTYGLHGEDLVTWFAKATSDVKSASTPLGQSYEIVVRKSKSGLIAKIQHNGKACPDAKFEVYGTGVSVDNLKSDKNGEIAVPAVKSGVLSLGAIVVEPVSGEYKGTHYKDKMILVTATVSRL